MSIQLFDEDRFRAQVDAALEQSRKVLDNTKNPTYAADVPHKYDDKYLLSEFLCNTALAAQLNCLELLGLDAKKLQTIKEWSATRSVTLRLHAEESCTFLRKTKREEEDPTKHVREYTGVFGGGKREDKIVRTIHEWFWNVHVSYELYAFQGNTPDKKVVLQARTADCEVMTSSESPPYSSKVVRDHIDLNLTWMLKNINANARLVFAIDRTRKSCHTPRRNDDVTSALGFMREITSWNERVHSYLSSMMRMQQNNALDMASINIKTLFNPVVPLFEERAAGAAVEPAAGGKTDALVPIESVGQSQVLLSIGEVNSYLDEQKRSMTAKCAELAETFPRDEKLVTMAEAAIQLAVLFSSQIAQFYSDGVDYIEDMLRKQLIAAIGKEVTPVDFANYMTFHNRKLFREEFQPQPFCYAIRRPDHYPEGVLSIEAQLEDGSMPDPISTVVSRTEARAPLKFSIHAAANVSFTGECFLHAFVGHQFSGQTAAQFNLIARARQFSSFLVLIGRIAGPGLFEPKYGMIVQNKDDIKIPLELETIPTPKEFADAISSLSPEQQRFATAFRSMQLASTLFGVCVIQIKPQLEKLLKLPYDSLTKEIQMTQDLLEMFIKYQIPSDLLSFGGAAGSPEATKLEEVKTHIRNMQEMISISKDKELKEAGEVATFAALDRIASSAPGGPVLLGGVVGRGGFGGGGGGGGGGVVAGRGRGVPLVAGGRAAQRSVNTSGSTSGGSPAPADPKPSDKPSEPKLPSTDFAAVDGNAEVVDYTKLPQEMDAKFQKLDEDSALRPTIINVAKSWTKRSKKGLLSDFTTTTMQKAEMKLEKQRCYDLLDALTKSGCLSVEGATLHVVMTATHCFDQNIMNTLVQDNINPIEKVERSTLIVATVIHDRPAEELVKPEQLERARTYSPGLFVAAAAGVKAIANSNN